MKHFCITCGTEAVRQEICSGCGNMMRTISDNHVFILEIIDQVVSSRVKEAIVYERRGPFSSAVEADNWWKRSRDHTRYTGCDGMVVLLEPPQTMMVDKDSN